jgi:acetyl-CoA acetyltransferase
MAGCGPDDVTACELYDCYTFTVLKTLEDYGFCKLGEGGPFAEEGRLGPGGSLPTNTGGGELSSYYMWGMTPISEAIIQTRGQGGERQVERNDLIAVSGNGGMFNYHSTLLLSPHAS